MTDTAAAGPAAPEFVLCLYRSTAHPRRMVAFLEALGLHRTVEGDQDGTTFLWGRSGMVAVFDAASDSGPAPVGQTQLSFETPDLGAAEAHLTGRGRKVTVWDDEGEQRSGGTFDPQGAGVFMRESERDADDAGSDHPRVPVDVVAVRESADFAADEEFFAGFGFTRAYGDENWMALAGRGDAGVIGLHAPWGEDRGGATTTKGAPALVHLGFQTDGGLEPVAERLRAAGLEPRVSDRSGALVVVDPDGVEIEVHPAG